MKIYVAGSSAELDRVSAFMSRLRAAGHEITHDWTAAIRDSGKPANGLSRGESEDAAWKCRDAIDRSDVFVFLAPITVSEGAWFEFGFAVGGCVRALIVGERPRSIFAYSGSYAATEDDALAMLAEWGAR